MPADTKTPKGFSLRRWSRRKLEAARDAASSEAPVPAPSVAPVAQVPAAIPTSVPGAPPAAAETVLPPLESLTAESDFTAFMHPKVDEGLRRQALKKLFADPRFNVMDGLDVYIDDYTKPDPIPAGVLERLAQMGFVRDAGASPVEASRSEAPEGPVARALVAPETTSDPAAADPVPRPTPPASADSSDTAAEPSGNDGPSVPRPSS